MTKDLNHYRDIRLADDKVALDQFEKKKNI